MPSQAAHLVAVERAVNLRARGQTRGEQAGTRLRRSAGIWLRRTDSVPAGAKVTGAAGCNDRRIVLLE